MAQHRGQSLLRPAPQSRLGMPRRSWLPEIISFALVGVVLGSSLIFIGQYLAEDMRAQARAPQEWVALAAPVSRLSEKANPLVPLRLHAPQTAIRPAKVARLAKSDPLEHPLLQGSNAPLPQPQVLLASVNPAEAVAALGQQLRQQFAVADIDSRNRPKERKLLRTPPIWKLEQNWKLARSERLRILKKRKQRLRELTCLAKAIYFEARSESTAGKLAVAKVVLNRVRDPRFPSTICGVVYQGAEYRNACQFSFACDGKPDYPADRRQWRIAKQLAAKALKDGIRMKALEGVAFYHADYVRPRWASAMRRVVKIGRHIFYRDG